MAKDGTTVAKVAQMATINVANKDVLNPSQDIDTDYSDNPIIPVTDSKTVPVDGNTKIDATAATKSATITVDAKDGSSVELDTKKGNTNTLSLGANKLGSVKTTAGDDTIKFTSANGSATSIDGGAGKNTLDLASAGGIDLSQASITNIDTVVLGANSGAMLNANVVADLLANGSTISGDAANSWLNLKTVADDLTLDLSKNVKISEVGNINGAKNLDLTLSKDVAVQTIALVDNGSSLPNQVKISGALKAKDGQAQLAVDGGITADIDLSGLKNGDAASQLTIGGDVLDYRKAGDALGNGSSVKLNINDGIKERIALNNSDADTDTFTINGFKTGDDQIMLEKFTLGTATTFTAASGAGTAFTANFDKFIVKDAGESSLDLTLAQVMAVTKTKEADGTESITFGGYKITEQSGSTAAAGSFAVKASDGIAVYNVNDGGGKGDFEVQLVAVINNANSEIKAADFVLEN